MGIPYRRGEMRRPQQNIDNAGASTPEAHTFESS